MIEDEGETRLDAVFVLECIAPVQLHVDRFLPPTPISITVVGGEAPDMESMIEEARIRANQQIPALIAAARQDMTAQLTAEITRLQVLKKLNPSVRDEEIRLLEDQQAALEEHICNARVRLDSLRLNAHTIG